MLNDYRIATFRPRAKPYTYTDGRGLFLLMTPIGSKLWRFSYRFDGKQHTIAGGSYPEVSIVLARAWRDAMRQQLASGINPAEERWKQKRMRSEEHTSELQSLMRISYAVFCLKKKKKHY